MDKCDNSIFDRLSKKLNDMTREALKPLIGEKNTEDNLKKAKLLTVNAYAKFYEECTVFEREILELEHPVFVEATGESDGFSLFVSIKSKRE